MSKSRDDRTESPTIYASKLSITLNRTTAAGPFKQNADFQPNNADLRRKGIAVLWFPVAQEYRS